MSDGESVAAIAEKILTETVADIAWQIASPAAQVD
jgi:hypothetical protein